jgi:hypothetical protein
MLRTTLLLGGLLLALSACGPRYPYYPPSGGPPPVPVDPSRVTPPPPPVDVIRPKV